MCVRPATEADLAELVAMQEEASVVALAPVFPQDTQPFPRVAVLQRWRSELHDALIETWPGDLDRVWLRVFEENQRARRFWAKHGWEPTGRTSRSTFAPHPVLVEYELDLRGRQ